MWYNESLKNEYINNNIIIQRNQHLENYINNYFNITSTWEKKLSKDICNFTANEIITLYKSLFTSSLEYLMVINSQLSNYTKYCMSKDIVTDHQNHFEEMSKEVLMECVNRKLLEEKIISKKQMIDYIESSELKNAVDKYIIQGLFLGLLPEELVDLRMDNFVGYDIHINNKIIPTNLKFKENTKKAIEDTEYYIYTENTRNNIYKLNPEDPSPIKVKEGYDIDGTKSAKYQRMSKKLAALQKNTRYSALTYKSLRESGRIAMIKELHEETGKTMYECIKDKKISEIYGKVGAVQRYIMKYRKWLTE